MDAIELIVADLESTVPMLAWHLGDFSEADMLHRPFPNANHTTWQVGHLAAAEAGMMNKALPGSVTLDAGFIAKFTKANCKLDDASVFVNKQALLDALTNVRAQTVAATKKLKPSDLQNATSLDFAPTLSSLLLMHSMHTAMHLGQVQVIRRALGKSYLF